MAVIMFLFISHSNKEEPSLQPFIPSPSKIPENPSATIEFKNNTYAYDYFVVSDVTKLSLIPNFSEKATSLDIFEKNSCTSGISGGFYDTNNSPLGGFMTNNSVLKLPVKNRLIDGFLWVKGEKAVISLDQPSSDARFYVQTGPLLLINGGVTRISIANDEYRRRNIVALSKNGDLIFLTIYNPESVYDGPLLSDMPSILKELDKKVSSTLTDAINLDGGSASAFISKTRTLQEFSTIGSFLCVYQSN